MGVIEFKVVLWMEVLFRFYTSVTMVLIGFSKKLYTWIDIALSHSNSGKIIKLAIKLFVSFNILQTKEVMYINQKEPFSLKFH